MSGCRGCGHDVGHTAPAAEAGSRDIINFRVPTNEYRWCQICRLLVPMIAGQSPKMIESEHSIQKVRESLGNPGTSTNSLWAGIRKMPDPAATSWARNPREVPVTLDLGIQPQSWELQEGDFALLSSRERKGAPNEQLRRLQRGGYLPDGSFLSWSAGRWALDGKWIKLPYRGLSKLLRRKRGLEEVNWRQLLYSIDWAVRPNNQYAPWDEPRETGHMIHPVADIIYGNAGPRDHRMFRIPRNRAEAPTPTKADLADTEWMRRWEEWESSNPDARDAAGVPVTLNVRGGRLQLRVRRNSGWRRIELGSHPDVWSKVITWALSPPQHGDRRTLNCIQQFLFADPDAPLIPSKDRRGMALLRGVLDSSDRVEIDSRGKSLNVTGTSGLRYSIVPGEGGHGTRFVVRPLDPPPRRRPEDIGARWRHHRLNRAICIVEKPELRRLVIGDAITSIVLSLLDDLNSQRQINTLRSHIRAFQERPDPLEVEQMREARWLDNRLLRNPVNARVRRYTELFPRLWGALLRLPLGERVTFTAMRRGQPNVSFDGCETEFATTSRLDREILHRMLESSGWVRDREEERTRATREVYIRTGTGNRDQGQAVEGFCQAITPTLNAGRVRLVAAPLWTYYERNNPGTSPLLPGTNLLIE